MEKIKELNALTKEELRARFIDLKKELMKQNAQIAIGTVPKSPGKVRQTKKNIARILMLISQKKKVMTKEGVNNSNLKIKNKIQQKLV